MHRTQISLDSWQYEQLKAAAERDGRSIASLVREAVTDYLKGSRKRSATKLAEIRGLGSDPARSGEHHDDVIYGPARDADS